MGLKKKINLSAHGEVRVKIRKYNVEIQLNKCIYTIKLYRENWVKGRKWRINDIKQKKKNNKKDKGRNNK